LRVIWVLENIHGDEGFYSRFNILLLLSSVTLWKKNHPEHHLVFYCDPLTKDIVEKTGGLIMFDEVNTYRHTLTIDRKIFWACNKVKVLSEQTEPCIIMDNDTLVFKPFEKYLKDDIIVANLETGKGYYPGNIDPFVRRLKKKVRWQQDSLNVSFLYFPEPSILQYYANECLGLMEEFTEMKVPNSQYLIFAEQLLLRNILDTKKIKYKSIISTYWDCVKWDWGEHHDKGIWNFPESELYFKHYGPEKKFIIAGNTVLGYEEECKLLENCINIRKLDVSFIPKR
jgi:hypothetical protein